MSGDQLVMTLIAMPLVLLMLWLAACDFGQPFVALFVIACGAWGFVAGYVARGEGR